VVNWSRYNAEAAY